MKNLVKKAMLVTATATGLALLGATGSAFASTAPDATGAVKGATHSMSQQAKDKSDDPVGGGIFPPSDDATTNNGDVAPSLEQSVKRFNRGGAMVGGGAASMLSSAWVGIPQQAITDGKQIAGKPVTQVTDHIHG